MFPSLQAQLLVLVLHVPAVFHRPAAASTLVEDHGHCYKLLLMLHAHYWFEEHSTVFAAS
jgi:hypothetical protein